MVFVAVVQWALSTTQLANHVWQIVELIAIFQDQAVSVLLDSSTYQVLVKIVLQGLATMPPP